MGLWGSKPLVNICLAWGCSEKNKCWDFKMLVLPVLTLKTFKHKQCSLINTCITKITIITVINLYTVNGKHITIKAFCTNHTNVHRIVMCVRRWLCGYFYNTCIYAKQLNAYIFCWEMYIKQYMVYKNNQTHALCSWWCYQHKNTVHRMSKINATCLESSETHSCFQWLQKCHIYFVR